MKHFFISSDKQWLRTIVCLILVNWMTIPVFSQLNPLEAVPKYEIPDLKYPTSDAYVISINALDYGADPTGENDNYPIFSALLNKLSKRVEGGAGNGGVLFIPEGIYRLDSGLVLPKGITIRGEWKKPVKGEPIKGTIISTSYGKGRDAETSASEETYALITMQPSSAVKDLAFWYPEQDANNIVPYAPTILYGQNGYFGNEYCLVQNVTLINSYDGVIYSRRNSGGAPNAFGVYGTPLKRGIEIDNISEVGRIEGVDFSPEYWLSSGLPNVPRNEEHFKKWMKNNATGIVMRRNDWSLTSCVNVEGYYIGFHAVVSALSNDGLPNGQNYNLTFTDCVTGIYASNPQNVGIMFHKINIENCEYGVFFPNGAGGVIQFSKANINANQYAIASDSQATTRIFFHQSEVTSGQIVICGGTFTIMDSDINNEAPQLILGPDSRGIVTGNRFSSDVVIENNSIYECQIDHTPLNLRKIPDFPYKDPQTIKQKPDRSALYVVTDAPFNAKNDETTDNTEAIQSALNKAKNEGGGIVYLPAGKYKVSGNLTVPSGVELQGAMNIGSLPTGPGSVLEVYAGKGNEEGEPFLKLSEGSGLRGIVFNYPEQIMNEMVSGSGSNAVLNPHKYPYCIQVTGKNVYVVNVAFRATWKAIDLFSHKCDNFYAEYPAGHVFYNFIHVGGKTENARICNTQFNTIAYDCGAESKFGSWPNSQKNGFDNDVCYRQNFRDLHFLVLGDCKNLMLFNNFGFGSNKMTSFANEGDGPSGIALGHGIDAAVKALYFEKIGPEGFDLIGTQIVSLQQAIATSNTARYIETALDFTGEVNLYSADFWGGPYTGIQVAGGTVNLQLANFENLGENSFSTIAEGGVLKLYGSLLMQNKRVTNSGAESRFYAESSIFTPQNLIEENCAWYKNNLLLSAVAKMDDMYSRDGWIATASNNNEATSNALDSDPNTRWDTAAFQEGGEWFAVDMLEPQTFNKIVLDQGSSGGDYPHGYEVYVSLDGEYWGEPVIKNKIGSNNTTIIHFDEEITTRYVKIVQTGKNTGLYWSIHEFYIATSFSCLMETPTKEDVAPCVNIPQTKSTDGIVYYANKRLHFKGMNNKSQVNVYNISGQKVISATINASSIPLELMPDIYLVNVVNEGQVYRQKIIIP